jgi:RNA polymerase sigma-70 factor, ECF subfamily
LFKFYIYIFLLLIFASLQTMDKAKSKMKEETLDNPVFFKDIFLTYNRPLTVFALRYLNDLDSAQEVVQELFIHLWEKRKTLSIQYSIKAYLFQSVKNACVNKKLSYREYFSLTEADHQPDLQHDVIEKMIAVETEERIFKAMEQLPDKCREVFYLSRVRGLKNSEIARSLKISPKTVENQIGKAIKKLIGLRKYIAMIAQLLFNLLWQFAEYVKLT